MRWIDEDHVCIPFQHKGLSPPTSLGTSVEIGLHLYLGCFQTFQKFVELVLGTSYMYLNQVGCLRVLMLNQLLLLLDNRKQAQPVAEPL